MVCDEEKAKFSNIEMFFCPKIAEKGMIYFFLGFLLLIRLKILKC